MDIQELNKKKVPIISIDPSLEKYVNMPLFQEKVDEANETLKRVGLPKTRKLKIKGVQNESNVSE
jgi:hypothetical protein